MDNFTTKQGALFYCYTLDVEQISKIDVFLDLLNKSSIAGTILKAASVSENGRPNHPPLRMFACVLYGFSRGRATLRELEESCRYDLRFKYIMGGAEPSYSSFSRFINDVIKPHSQELFTCVTKAIFDRFGLSFDDCYIDGTKFEADANRYKYVWKPTAHHEKLSNKVRRLLAIMVLDRGVPKEGIVPASLIASKLTEAGERRKEIPEDDAGGNEAWTHMMENLKGYLSKAVEYEEKERICGPGRNSYYKTDHDATAMCLKRDYYSGLGSNMHAAYQVQFVVSSGLIASYYISQDRTDIHTFIPTFEVFHDMFGTYPRRIGADAGYGCLQNYRYCDEHGIEGYLKYQTWEGECSGKRPALYELDADGNLFCLGGRMGVVTDIPGKHHRQADTVFYVVDGCTGCSFMPYCRQFMAEKTGDSKVFEVNPEAQLFKQKARDMLLSVEGIEMRVNRSCQAEGSFGDIKYNMGFERFRRTGMEQVTVELMLTALGLNLRKFFRYSNSGWKAKVWTAPEGTKPERFKKPSAKRLANRVVKKQTKSVNQLAQDSYKYKKLGPKKDGGDASSN